VNVEHDGIYTPPTTRSQDELAPKIQDEPGDMQSQHNVQEFQERIAMFIGQDLLVWWTYLSIRQSHFDQAMANESNRLQMFMAQDLLVWWIYMKIQ